MEVNKCVGCRQPIAETAKFCRLCGTAQELPPANIPAPPDPVQRNFGRSAFIIEHKVKFILGGIAGLVVIVLLGVSISSRNQTPNPESSGIPRQSRSADTHDNSNAPNQMPTTPEAQSPADTVTDVQTEKAVPVQGALPGATQATAAQGQIVKSPVRSRALNRDGLNALADPHPDLAIAKQDFEEAVKADNTNIEALNNLGWIDGRMGNYSLAKTVLEKVLSLDPDRRVAQANLGYVMAKLGDVTGASSHFCRLIALSSSQSAARKVLRGEDKDPDPNVHAAVAQAIHDCGQ